MVSFRMESCAFRLASSTWSPTLSTTPPRMSGSTSKSSTSLAFNWSSSCFTISPCFLSAISTAETSTPPFHTLGFVKKLTVHGADTGKIFKPSLVGKQQAEIVDSALDLELVHNFADDGLLVLCRKNGIAEHRGDFGGYGECFGQGCEVLAKVFYLRIALF